MGHLPRSSGSSGKRHKLPRTPQVRDGMRFMVTVRLPLGRKARKSGSRRLRDETGGLSMGSAELAG